MRARYYTPNIKRLINQDILTGSIGESPSLNRYSYVQGNPVSYLAPFGLAKGLSDSLPKAEIDAYLEDGPNVVEGKNFTATQKQKMLKESMKRNGGVVKSDKKESQQVQMNGNLTILFPKIKEEQIAIQIVRLFQENLIEKNGIISRR